MHTRSCSSQVSGPWPVPKVTHLPHTGRQGEGGQHGIRTQNQRAVPLPLHGIPVPMVQNGVDDFAIHDADRHVARLDRGRQDTGLRIQRRFSLKTGWTPVWQSLQICARVPVDNQGARCFRTSLSQVKVRCGLHSSKYVNAWRISSSATPNSHRYSGNWATRSAPYVLRLSRGIQYRPWWHRPDGRP